MALVNITNRIVNVVIDTLGAQGAKCCAEWQ